MQRDAHGAESTRYGWMREPCAKANRASVYKSFVYAMDAKGTPSPLDGQSCKCKRAMVARLARRANRQAVRCQLFARWEQGYPPIAQRQKAGEASGGALESAQWKQRSKSICFLFAIDVGCGKLHPGF